MCVRLEKDQIGKYYFFLFWFYYDKYIVGKLEGAFNFVYYE